MNVHFNRNYICMKQRFSFSSTFTKITYTFVFGNWIIFFLVFCLCGFFFFSVNSIYIFKLIFILLCQVVFKVLFMYFNTKNVQPLLSVALPTTYIVTYDLPKIASVVCVDNRLRLNFLSIWVLT